MASGSDVESARDAPPARLPWRKQWRTWSLRRPCLWTAAVSLCLALVALCIAASLACDARNIVSSARTRRTLVTPAQRGPAVVLERNFADPCYITVGGVHHAFATNRLRDPRPGQVQVQVQLAMSLDFVHWQLTDHDALPDAGPWSTNASVWAPDVIQRDDGVFVLYYAAQTSEGVQCIGAALAEEVRGPYMSLAKPVVCPSAAGGAIDPEGFRDVDGTRYLVYKVDGNSRGLSTPLMLQELAEDAASVVDAPVRLLDRDATDGPLIEAPALGRYERDGRAVYVLFFSSHMFDGPEYNVKYATSASVRGPFVRASQPLLSTAGELIGPGGIDVGVDSTRVVFHSIKKGQDVLQRNMAVGELSVDGETIQII